MSTTKLTTGQILVTGASGELGKLTLHHLLHTVKIKPKQIIAGSGSPDKLKAFADQGVQLRYVDFADPATITAAAQGVERALLISTVRDNDGGDSHMTAARKFGKAGVQHILYTSVQATFHRPTEIFIQESGIPGYTILRNERRQMAHSMVARDVKERATYEITGPKSLSINEIVAQISRAIEKPLEVAQVSEDELIDGVDAGLGLPEVVGQIYASIDKIAAAGLAQDVTDHYKQLTGVDPITHHEWAQKDQAILKALLL